ncbi:MAG: ATP synthase subunit I [Desulfobulbaceae bacterium]|nr:ATP synthase subunit I [Desulfobulbaceae bacterium]
MARNKLQLLGVVQLSGWGLLALMVVAGWLGFGAPAGKSLLVGGLLANGSFWLLKRDLLGLLRGELTAVKSRFFIKYYSRLTLMAVLLFLIIRYGALPIPGLLIGLSTVFVSITAVAILGVRKELNIKEAS